MDYTHTSPNMSPSAQPCAPVEPKTVRFQLISPDSPHTTARLPMRVQIYPHDATDSIVTTVKNFYGLYSSPTSSKGVSFEDEAGNTMIARYENFRSNMVVYVRVIEEPALSPGGYASRNYRSPPAAAHGPGGGGGDGAESGHPAGAPYFAHAASSLQHFHHLQEQNGEYIARPGSRTSRKRSVSPNSNRGRRSVSASTHSKNRSRSAKNRGSQPSDAYGPDSMAGYSSGDGAPGSSNGRAKEQQPIGNTEISLENIVEGGRRKRAKFESSELPLFAPPQMPAATSNPSVSPARRSDHRPSLPYVHPGQNPFSGAGALHSPQHYNTHFGQGGVYATPGSDGRRTRASIGYSSAAGGMGVLPTPDPTVSSLSEEDKDVAMQLMRLGEISNMSYGRTSTSTQDDTFSGRADAASSTGATSDSESDSEAEADAGGESYADGEDDVAPLSRKQQRLDLDGASRKIYPSVETADYGNADYNKGIFVPAPGLMAAPKVKKVAKASTANGTTKQARPAGAAKAKPKASKAKANGALPFSANGNGTAAHGGGATKAKKTNGAAAAAAVSVPMSPASLPPSRKLSVSSTGGLPPIAAGPGALAGLPGLADEDVADLSSKPRCQRCRKSKKGCDRQRPCGRCRDAGIPAELCISEDEGNGRKGRYGRHMGVPVKVTAIGASSTSMQPPPPPPAPQQLQQHPAQHAPEQTAIPSPSHPSHSHPSHPHPSHPHPSHPHPSHPHHAPLMHAPVQQNPLVPQLQQLQQLQALPAQPLSHPPSHPLSHPPPPQPIKAMPSLLPPAQISSTPILPPAIPEMMMASAEKNKKRKR